MSNQGREQQHWKELEPQALAELNPDAAAYVRGRVNLDADNDLHAKSHGELLVMFGKAGHSHDGLPGEIIFNFTACVHTLVWQEWLQIRTGELAPIQGNLRSYWYRQLETFMIDKDLLYYRLGHDLEQLNQSGRAELDKKLGDDYRVVIVQGDEEKLRVHRAAREVYLENLISQVFGDFVENGVFRYKDEWQFDDPREGFHLIGRNRPRIVFGTEKQGLWWLCEYVHDRHGISVLASQGEPGLLATEYLVDELRAAKTHSPPPPLEPELNPAIPSARQSWVMRVASLVLGMLTDFDPWGRSIARNMRDKLAKPIFFDGKVELHHLDGTREQINRLFDEGRLWHFRRNLAFYNQQAKAGQIQEWGKSVGGVSFPGDPEGTYYGIHVDVADPKRLRQFVDDWVVLMLNKRTDL